MYMMHYYMIKNKITFVWTFSESCWKKIKLLREPGIISENLAFGVLAIMLSHPRS